MESNRFKLTELVYFMPISPHLFTAVEALVIRCLVRLFLFLFVVFTPPQMPVCPSDSLGPNSFDLQQSMKVGADDVWHDVDGCKASPTSTSGTRFAPRHFSRRGFLADGGRFGARLKKNLDTCRMDRRDISRGRSRSSEDNSDGLRRPPRPSHLAPAGRSNCREI